MCQHHFIHTTHTRVCDKCGVETTVLRLDTFNVFSAPLCKGYQRAVRFRQKIDKLLYLQNAPALKCPVWKYLESQKELSTPGDVRRSLRTYTGKNKHYDCIRLFTRVFTPFRVSLKRSPDRLNALLTQLFSSIIRLWNRHNMMRDMPFFSYDFLLRNFLEKLESPLVVFCKPVTCHKRHVRNNERLKLISILDDDEKYYQSFVVDRFQNGIHSVETPPCPRTSAALGGVEVVGEGATCRAIRPLGVSHDLSRTSEIKQGGGES